MGSRTSIEWRDGGATWNPIRARNRATGAIGWFCAHVSEGCRNCYAEALNHRLGTGVDFKAKKLAQVELLLDEKMLMQPLHWHKPRKIFVCSMTDLFASFVPDEWIDRFFAVMALCPQHTFIVLTKRAKRMRDYLSTPHAEFNWPLPNIWSGVSIEDQAAADARIPPLLQTPAVVRFVSAEPLLVPLNLMRSRIAEAVMPFDAALCDFNPAIHVPLNWVIVGGESGPQARPLNIEWVRSIIAQCKAAGVACFVKQLGAMPIIEDALPFGADWPHGTRFGNRTGIKSFNGRCVLLRDPKGGDWREWPDDLRVRQYPEDMLA